MKRKLFLGMGALALTLGGVMAGRASSKFLGAQNLYYKTAGAGCAAILSASNAKFVTGTTYNINAALTFETSGNAGSYAIFGTSGCAKRAYFLP